MPITFYDTAVPGHGFDVHNFGSRTSPTFSRNPHEYEAQSYNRRRTNACNLANAVAKEARELSHQFEPNSDMAKLTADLATYITSKTSSSNYDNIERRANFVRSCLNAIRAGNHATLRRLLAEQDIAPFKGCFTQRLYNLVKPYQDYNSPFLFLPAPASSGHTAARARATDSENAMGPGNDDTSPLLAPRTP